jgi:hypothetical protein
MADQFVGGKHTVGGPMIIKWNGYVLEVTGDHTINFGKMKREEKLGPNGEFHGFVETPQMGRISGKIVLTRAVMTKLEEILTLQDGTLTIKLPNGQVIMMEQAFFSGEGDLSTESGEMDYEFKGNVKFA